MKGGERKMNRKFKAAAWAVLLILFVLSGVIVHAQDETMSTNTPESILEETSKEVVVESNVGEDNENLQLSEEEIKETVADAANGDKNAGGNVVPGTPGGTDTTDETGTTDETDTTGDDDQKKDPDETGTTEPSTEAGKDEPDTTGDDDKQTDPEGTETPEEPKKPGEGGEGTETKEGDDGSKDDTKEPEKTEETGKTGEGTGENKPAQAEDDGEPTKPVVEKDQINRDSVDDLSKKKAEIEAEKDPKKKKALEAEYNKMYFEALEKSGAEKLDDSILDRFTDKYRTKEYYALKEEYEALKKKAEEGKITQEEIDAFNKKLGTFDPPRKLEDDEKDAQKKLANSVDVPGLKEGSTDDAKEKLDAYNKAKEALKNALDSEKARETSKEELKKLVDAFEAAEKALKDGINDESIKPTYTDGKPTVRVFPLTNGSVGDELTQDPKKDAPYYIPDNTSIELLVHVNKDEEPKDFTFTIRAADKGAIVDGEKASNLAFLNGKPVDLVRNEDGSYTFKVSANDMNFGIAQLRFNIPGFEGPFHKGFDLEMELNGEKVTKQFRITKKGYEDEANLDGKGSDKNDDPSKIPEVDAGKTENAIVDKDTDKVHDFFTYLKKSNTYIDKLTFNSGNGHSLPLDSVDITITVPKHDYDNEFAEMIHKSGLEYHDLGNGKYQLKLDRKVFGGNLIKTEDGKLMVGDKELTEANLKDVLLENAGKKVYVDEKGDAHDIITSEVLTDEKGKYKVENGKLYKKNGEDQNKFDEIGTFDKDGKIEKDGKTYLLKDGKLISYTKEYDVYEGNVVNKDGKADPNVTPTYEGNQVTIETEVEKDGKTEKETSYGGTIVKDAIYDKNGKIFNEEGYIGQAGTVLIGADGKAVNGITYDPKDIKEDKKTGVKIVTVDGVSYHIVENPVFKNDYIIDGLEYKEGLSLIDKFGKKMNVKVTEEEGTYTFTKILKDKEGNEIEDEDKVKSGKKDKRNVIVGTDNNQILVNNKNEVVENEEKDGKKTYDLVGPKYYYNGKEFVAPTVEGLKGDKFFEDFEEFILKKTTTYSYMDGKEKKEITDFDKKTIYEGSLNPKDYFKVDEKIYVKKSQGAGNTAAEYYVSADPKASNEILSVNKIAKIVQTLGEGDKAIEKVTDETDIFDAVQNAKFALRYPGFLAGKNVVYKVHADVKATYKKPIPGKEGEFENVDVFSDDKGIKKIDKFFTLKNEKETSTLFFKHAPKELQADPAVNLHFFNIFYRNADDRQRDQLIVDLLVKEEDVKKAEAKVNDAKSDKAKKEAQDEVDKLKKEYKEELALIAKFKDELKRLYDGATFNIVKDKEGKDTLVIKDKDGKEISADELNKMRSLLWEVGFENKEGTLFPENSDTEIIIEDHNLDNRLIYDEIIVNDTRENWDKLNKAHEEAKKKVSAAEKALKDNKNESQKEKLEQALEEAEKALKEAEFKGNKEYFFLDQIKDIRFGVSPNYIDGRFVPLGENFKITGQEIIEELKKLTGDSNEVTIKKNGIDFKITRDKVNGQIRIKVLNAFYKKVENDSTHKFESPAQKAYQKKIDDLIGQVDNLSEDNIEDFVKTLHAKESECFGIIKQKLTEEFTKVNKKPQDLEKFKENLKAEIKKIELKYLDSNKGKYKYDDMRFNAIRIGLNPNITIGGAMNPENTKKIGISSVIVPDIDIPYTDEFGKALTNKDMYVKAEIEKILKDGIGEGQDKKTFTKDDLKNEEKFREIMAEAYKRVNNKNIEIKDLVIIKNGDENKVGMEKYTVVEGSKFKFDDLAVDGKVLKNKEGFAINPWYIVKGDKTKSVEDIFKAKFGAGYKDMPEYKELEDMPIDIAAYYMSKQGYDRNKYANQANYKLSAGDKKDGIFGSDSDWHKKICYPGIGHCIEQAGKDHTPGENPEAGKFGAEGKNGADFELTYEPTNKGPEKEEPKVDKKTEEKDKSVDITGEEDKKVDFTIDVTVDKMTKKQKDIADALTPEKPKKPGEMTDEEKAKAEAEKKAEEKAKKIEAENYNGKGYYEYKNSLIIDFLPEIFKLKQGENGTTLTLNVSRKKLMANGANKKFESEEEFNKWKEGIEYFYTDDLMSEYKKLSESSKEEDKEKAAVLKKAIDDAKAEGRIKDNQKIKAVIAWVPTFEAPHGSKEQFKFELKNVYVDKKKYKDFVDNVIGTNYTNHAAFGDKARFYFGETTVNIYEKHEGSVNKYLQLLDKNGKVIDKDKAEGWFKGGAELKFGDKFNYRIEYHNNTGVVAVPGEANNKSEIKIEDLFAKVKDNGLRPVLNGYITSDFDLENQYKVIYKIGEKEYTKDQLESAIKAKTAKFSDVTSVVLEGKYENGATHNFYIPMMIPEFDAEIKDGKVYYQAKDGEKKLIGDAKDFFDLDKLNKADKDMFATNKVKGSNTVTVYLEKERFVKVFKEFLAANGEKLKNLDNLEAKFDIYQIIEENGVKKHVKVGELKANKDNNFTDMIDHLPIFKKITTIDKNGTVKVKEVRYEYKLKEHAMPGFESRVWQLEDNNKLGFVWKATNTEKPEEPEEPGENPKEEPKEVKVTFRVNKVWKDLKGDMPTSIEVELIKNGKPTGKTITLSAANGWSASFADLPAEDEYGNEIKYSVREVGEGNKITMIGDRKFEVSYTGDIMNGFTITNSEIPNEKPKEKEEHEDDEDEDDHDHEDKIDEEDDGGKNIIPKTGVRTDLGSIFFSGILLLALFFFKRKYFKN